MTEAEIAFIVRAMGRTSFVHARVLALKTMDFAPATLVLSDQIGSLCINGRHAPLFDCDSTYCELDDTGANRPLFWWQCGRSYLARKLAVLLLVVAGIASASSLRLGARKGTVRVRLSGPAMLADSSSVGHKHLFLNVHIRWFRCAIALCAFWFSGAIGPGFFYGSVRRRMCLVRRPGYYKPCDPWPEPVWR
jgi:hypothetical protein